LCAVSVIQPFSNHDSRLDATIPDTTAKSAAFRDAAVPGAAVSAASVATTQAYGRQVITTGLENQRPTGRFWLDCEFGLKMLPAALLAYK
jgi:hypothetical protein